jgi:hypothetical protein
VLARPLSCLRTPAACSLRPRRRLTRGYTQRDRAARRQRLDHRGRTRREPAVFELVIEPAQDLVGVDDPRRYHDVEVRLTFDGTIHGSDVVEGDKTAGVIKRHGPLSRLDRWCPVMSVVSPRVEGRGDAVKGATIDLGVVRVGEVGYSLALV